MVSSDKQNIAILLASLVDCTNGLIRSGYTLNSGFIHTGMANHVRWSKVIHHELEFILADTLGHLLANTLSAHLRIKVVGSDLGRRNHVAHFTGKLLFDSTVEEERDVRVLLCLGDVALLNILLAEPFSKNVAHVLGWEGNREGVVGLVLGHGSDGDVLGVREVRTRGSVVVTQQLGDLTDTVRAVVEEEEGIAV